MVTSIDSYQAHKPEFADKSAGLHSVLENKEHSGHRLHLCKTKLRNYLRKDSQPSVCLTPVCCLITAAFDLESTPSLKQSQVWECGANSFTHY